MNTIGILVLNKNKQILEENLKNANREFIFHQFNAVASICMVTCTNANADEVFRICKKLEIDLKHSN